MGAHARSLASPRVGEDKPGETERQGRWRSRRQGEARECGGSKVKAKRERHTNWGERVSAMKGTKRNRVRVKTGKVLGSERGKTKLAASNGGVKHLWSGREEDVESP
eukprot:2635540-Pleurochrysis_carterae.AAC.3